MQVFFISGVDTNVGKTFTTQAILSTLLAKGKRAIAIKPIETGGEPLDSIEHLKMAQKIFPHFSLQEINFYSFPLASAPYVADTHQEISLKTLFERIDFFKDRVEILLIEGAGGLYVPIKKNFYMLSLAEELQKRFQSKVILVCDDKLGMINRFLSAKFILDSLKLDYLFFVNLRDRQVFETVNLPFLKDYDFETQIENLVQRMLKGEEWKN